MTKMSRPKVTLKAARARVRVRAMSPRRARVEPRVKATARLRGVTRKVTRKKRLRTDDAEFFVRFSLAACGGDDDDAALAEPFAIPRRPRTVPEPEGAAEGEGDGEGEGEGDGGDAPEEAAAEGEGEGEGEEAAAPTPPVEEPDDPDTTFYADLPLTLATRDLLHRGVRFEMCKVETVPKAAGRGVEGDYRGRRGRGGQTRG
jgi:hypothetical protein